LHQRAYLLLCCVTVGCVPDDHGGPRVVFPLAWTGPTHVAFPHIFTSTRSSRPPENKGGGGNTLHMSPHPHCRWFSGLRSFSSDFSVVILLWFFFYPFPNSVLSRICSPAGTCPLSNTKHIISANSDPHVYNALFAREPATRISSISSIPPHRSSFVFSTALRLLGALDCSRNLLERDYPLLVASFLSWPPPAPRELELSLPCCRYTISTQETNGLIPISPSPPGWLLSFEFSLLSSLVELFHCTSPREAIHHLGVPSMV